MSVYLSVHECRIKSIGIKAKLWFVLSRWWQSEPRAVSKDCGEKKKKKNFEVIFFFFFLKETTGINSLMEAILNFCPPDGWCRTTRRIKEMKREMSSRGKKNGDWKKKTKEKEKGKSFKSSHDWKNVRYLAHFISVSPPFSFLPDSLSLSLSLMCTGKSVDKGDHLKAISFHWPMISSWLISFPLFSEFTARKKKVTSRAKLSSSSSVAFDLYFSPRHLLSSTGNERLYKLVLKTAVEHTIPSPRF